MGAPQTILVIFGITGDLAQRKLLPALSALAQAGQLPPTQILGISRRDISTDEVLQQAFGGQQAQIEPLQGLLRMHMMDLAEAEGYAQLAEEIAGLRAPQPDAQVIFYLSVPPQASLPIVELLGQAGLNQPHVKLLLEKPFGVDLPSAEEAVATIGQYFTEDQLYRIDHYLAKEMAQNIVAFRGQNALLRALWSNTFIDSIEVIASETMSIEGRAVFYEQTGALRDVLQNHLLQLLALTIMDLPGELAGVDIPQQRLAALRQLSPIDPQAFDRLVRRGQYRGYAEEVNNPGSQTETLARVTLYSDDPNWQGVPLTLTTGKCLQEQTTEIRIRFKQAHAAEANSLILHLQPKEGIEIDLWAKKPGYDKSYEPVSLGFDYRQQSGRPVAAYERVLLDSIASDRSLFTTADEVLAAWRLLQPVIEQWSMRADDLLYYEPGSAIEEVA